MKTLSLGTHCCGTETCVCYLVEAQCTVHHVEEQGLDSSIRHLLTSVYPSTEVAMRFSKQLLLPLRIPQHSREISPQARACGESFTIKALQCWKSHNFLFLLKTQPQLRTDLLCACVCVCVYAWRGGGCLCV